MWPQSDPYARAIWTAEREIPFVNSAHEELLPFVGPPLGLPLWWLLARLPYRVAAIVWGALEIAAAMLIALGSVRLATARFSRGDALAALAFVGSFGPLVSGVSLGQVAIVSTAAVVAALLAAERIPWLAAAGTLAALQPNLGCVLVSIAGERRRFIGLALAAIATIAASAVFCATFGGLRAYLALLREHGSAERFIAIQTTPGAALWALGMPPAFAYATAGGIALAALAGIAFAALARGYAPADRAAIACAALPLALPFAHEHDFAIVIFPAIVCAVRASGPLRAIAIGAAVVAGVDWLGLAQRPTLVWEEALLALASTLAICAFRRTATPWLAAIAAAGVVLATGALVAHHTVPVWPDALAPSFAAPSNLSAAGVWRMEQLGTGLGAQTPAWGALRLLSLAGCATLAIAALRILRSSRTQARRTLM